MEADEFYARCRAREDDDCIEWAGAHQGPRPVVRWQRSVWQASRVAYLLHYGSLPPYPLRLAHTCATDDDLHRWCVNPRHLRVTGRPEQVAAYLGDRGDPKPKPTWQRAPVTPADLAAVLTARKEPPGIDPREDQP